MTYIQERGSTHVYHVNRMSKEEMDHMISLCVHEQPARMVPNCFVFSRVYSLAFSL